MARFECEEKFKYAFNHSTIGHSITLPSGEIQVNQAFSEMLGYSFEELRDQTWRHITHPDDIEATERVIEELLSRQKDSVHLIKRYVHKNGSVVWGDVNTSLRRDDSGRPLYFMTSVIDITERKRAEENLRESEERFREIFENTTVGMYRTTPDGRVLMANPALVRMLGYTSVEELAQRNLEENGFEPDYARSVFRRRVEAEGRVVGLESAWKRRDGKTLYVSESARCVRDGAGNVLYYEGTVEDITELKLAEQRLTLLSARQIALLAAIPEIVMEVDSNKIYTWANQAAIDFFGEDVIGKEAAFYFEGEQDTYSTVQPVFSGDEGTVYVESWQRRRDGQKRLLAWWCRTLKDSLGNVIGALSTARDVTERRLGENALRESERKYRSLVERAGDGILIIQDGLVRYVNPTLSRMWGGEQGKIIGTPFTAHIKPEDLAAVAEHYRRRLAGEDVPRVYQATLVRRDGSGVPAELNAEIIDYDGRPADFVIIRDLRERKQAEEALRASEEKFRLLAAHIKDVIYSVDAKTQEFSYLSPAFEKLLGYTAEDIRRMGGRISFLSQVIQGGDFEEQYRNLEKLKAQPAASIADTHESWWRAKDGSLKCLEDRWIAVREGGRLLTTDGVLIDITERHQAQEAIRSLARFPSENPGPILRLDEAGVLLYANDAALALLRDWNLEIGKSVQPDLREEIQKTSLGKRSRSLEMRCGERFFLMNVVPIPDASYINIYASDTTERKRAEKALQESEERFSMVFRSSPIATCIASVPDGRLVDVNEAFLSLFGYAREKVIGRTSLELNMWANPEEREDRVGAVRLQGKLSDVELKIRRKSGEICNVLVSSEMIELRGEPYMVSLIRDITERKRAEEKLRATLEEKDVLLREVHHRVKNNLQAMISLMDMHAAKELDAGTVQFLKELKEQARTMSLVYEQLYESENLARVAMDLYLKRLVSGVLESFGGGRPVEVEMDVAAIQLDVAQAMPCGLIVNELVTNSLKHAFPPGLERKPVLRVDLRSEDKGFALTVADNGVGLPPGPAVRAGRTFGLRLVNLWATHQLGGTVEVVNGVGTAYTIKFNVQSGRMG
jgi:PAS domain S-box-containing protein